MTSKIKKVCSVIGCFVLFVISFLSVILLPIFFETIGVLVAFGFVLLFLSGLGATVSLWKNPRYLKTIYTTLWISGLALVILAITIFGCIKLSNHVASLIHPETASISQPVTTATPAPTPSATVAPSTSAQTAQVAPSQPAHRTTRTDNSQAIAKAKAEQARVDKAKYDKQIADKAAADKKAAEAKKAETDRLLAKAAADKAAAEKLAAETEAKKLADAKAKQAAIDALAKAKQPSWYDDCSRHSSSNYTWNLTVNSSDFGMVSGVFVKITNSSGKVIFDNTKESLQGVYIKKLLPGTYSVTVTDGFVLTINQNHVQAEWDARLQQAVANNWARNFIVTDPLS